MLVLKKKKQFIKFFLVPFVLSFALFIAGFSFILGKPQRAQRVQEVFDTPEQVPRKTNSECIEMASVNYLTYKQIPEEEIKNNKFGLYIYAENNSFMELAQKLVNSNGGDWGYVLIPYNVRDHDYRKWKDVFDRLNNKHLIPIIQLWDVDTQNYEKETREAAQFLNSFAWPIKQRYISAYNEPNDAKFWYGKVDPVKYAQILDYTIDTFKQENENYFILNGALNISARSGGDYMDAFDFMLRMNSGVPGVFSKLDGWASHPYPQPNFSGSPHVSGRDSIRAYEAELNFLRNTLGVEKDLPVFITETGWAHAEGAIYNGSFKPVKEIAEDFKVAYEEYWLPDDRVMAVTPFTVRYPAPFDHFSWVNKDYVPYFHYDVVKSMEKVTGTPQNLIAGETYLKTCD